MEYAIIDVETTGHPLNKITDVAVFSTDGEKLIREFHSLVNPGVNIPYNITRLTGISNDTVQNESSEVCLENMQNYSMRFEKT